MKLTGFTKQFLAMTLALLTMWVCIVLLLGPLIPVGLTGGLILLRGGGCVYAKATQFQGMTAGQIAKYERQNELLIASLPFPFGVQPQNFEHLPYSIDIGDGRWATVGVRTLSTVNLPVEPDERELVENWVRDMEARGWRTSPLSTNGLTEGDLSWVVKAYKGNAVLDMHPSGYQMRLFGDYEAQAEKLTAVRCD